MNVTLTEQQAAIVSSAQDFLAARTWPACLREVLSTPPGWDEALWTGMAQELGWAGLMVPEEAGGSGLGAAEMALLLEQLGRTLAPVPFFETAVEAVQAVRLAGTAQQQTALLPRLAAGDVKAAFAMTGDDGRSAPHGIEVVLTPEGDGWRLSGHAGFAVSVCDDAILGGAGTAGAALDRLLSVCAALLAAEQTGAAAFSLDATVDYVKHRVQFGRPIGSFQAVKHALADMMLKVEAARSAMLYAAAAIDSCSPDLAVAAAGARAYCSEAFTHCASQAIQLHGGVGFTWDHHAHRYFKRARSSATLFGEPAEHYERVAQLIGLHKEAVLF
jgi:alkylation response protein AidB-like acyl-CoA dehydrogenase